MNTSSCRRWAEQPTHTPAKTRAFDRKLHVFLEILWEYMWDEIKKIDPNPMHKHHLSM